MPFLLAVLCFVPFVVLHLSAKVAATLAWGSTVEYPQQNIVLHIVDTPKRALQAEHVQKEHIHIAAVLKS